MSRFVPAFVLLIVAIGGVVLGSEEALKEAEGSYKVLSIEKGGKAPPDKEKIQERMKLQFKGEVMTVELGDGETKSAKIKLDPSKDPRTIDISPSDGPEKGKTFPGIYKLEKGELTLLFVESGKERPKGFTDVKDGMFLKCQKNEAK